MVALALWNTLAPDEAERELLSCCASAAWARRIAAGRPYPDVPAVLDAGAAAVAELPWADVGQAVAAHPRIGQRVDGTAREARWSRREQAGAHEADDSTAAELVAANQAYERRFDHVFLIDATGRTAREMLDAAHARLGHDEDTERRVVRAELAKITRRRLEGLLTS